MSLIQQQQAFFSKNKSWDISSAVHVFTESVGVSTYTLEGGCFSADGKHVYTTNNPSTSSVWIVHATLASAWDISNVIAGEQEELTSLSYPSQGISLNPAGSLLYISLNSASDKDIIVYDTTGQYGIDPLIFNKQYDYQLDTYDGRGIYVTEDDSAGAGNKYLFLANHDGSYTSMIKYTMDNLDLSTITLTQQVQIPGISNIRGVYFRDDGFLMFAIDVDNNILCKYHLSIAWDLSTILNVAQTFDTSEGGTGDTDPVGVHFKPEGDAFFIFYKNRNVRQFSI